MASTRSCHVRTPTNRSPDHEAHPAAATDRPARGVAQHPLHQHLTVRRRAARRPALRPPHRRARRLRRQSRRRSQRRAALARADGIPLYAADRAAICAGTHPVAIWPYFHHLTVGDTMTVTFHIEHHNRAELDALEIEGAPTLNVNNANAGHLQALLNLPPEPYGQIDARRTPRPHHRHRRLRPTSSRPTPSRPRHVAAAAARLGRHAPGTEPGPPTATDRVERCARDGVVDGAGESTPSCSWTVPP